MKLKLFYEEPDPDRWVPFDRYPRRVARRILRGKPAPSGQKRVFLNLCAGLDRLGVPYRVNDFRHARNNPDEPACIIGKRFVLDKMEWKNPIVFGASVFAHPSEDPDLFERLPVRAILVPGAWIRRMFESYYGDRVFAWPVGIETEKWRPDDSTLKDIDILLYDKVRWEHERYERELIQPVRDQLIARGLKCEEIRYGFYEEDDFLSLLKRSRAMVFLCEHETQGIAYQQALSCGVPILAWDRGGYWQDPSYFPHWVRFAPVTSVPYWDERCGLRFEDADEFPDKLDAFLDQLRSGAFSPRDYILENLTLEHCAQLYVDIVSEVMHPNFEMSLGQDSRARQRLSLNVP